MYSSQLLTSLYMFRVCEDVSAAVRKWYWPFDAPQFYTYEWSWRSPGNAVLIPNHARIAQLCATGLSLVCAFQ